MPFFSRLEPERRRLLLDRQRAGEREAELKLSLLRGLQGRHLTRTLPSLPSDPPFGHTLYNLVLDHARPWPRLGATPAGLGGDYGDFSLSFLGGGGGAPLLASVELAAGPRALPSRPGPGLGPLDRALRAAKAAGARPWAVVRKGGELGLYDLREETPVPATLDLFEERPALAKLDLGEVRDREQLAFLAAHFDRRALLGNHGAGELMTALDPDHPSAPLPAAPDPEPGAPRESCRLVATFTPGLELETPLVRLHDALRGAAVGPLELVRPHERGDRAARAEAWQGCLVEVREGWCALHAARARFAGSALGQIVYSEALSAGGDAQWNPDLGFLRLCESLERYFRAVRFAYDETWQGHGAAGLVSVSLREVRDWSLYVDGSLS
ncbi:MAG TPA: hypothetical protein VFS00_00760, partial [Polyangiaceae bacterium]|nr:hypothetical protein [Polyangiaceae bacterium]